ncbi:MAG: carboxypeptidase Q [Candidatus Krumholzibacteriia bacterium]|jgi:carboxypeptidase Q
MHKLGITLFLGHILLAAVPAMAGPDLQLDQILETAQNDPYAYDKLGELCDTVGHRMTGSPGMERAIIWGQKAMREAGLDSVWTEAVTVPYWTRGEEWARCVAPLDFPLDMLGLGRSDGTGGEPLEAEVMAVVDWAEFEERKAEADGKIVLFNMPWEGYGKSVKYRMDAASVVAEHGAVACLIRSVASASLGAPHTGVMNYKEGVPRIPVAALTVEDAGRLHRMTLRGLKPRVRLSMEAANHDSVTSYNVIGDLRGSEHPDEILLVSGHLDSWDVGTGAHDDGAGVVLALAAAKLFVQPERRLKRTVRVIFYAAEETGGIGGKAYRKAHKNEWQNHVIAMESDGGTEALGGFNVDADSTIVAAFAKRLAPLSVLTPIEWTVKKGGAGIDVRPLVEQGVIGIGHRVVHSMYFDVHHSRADTFDKIDPSALSQNVAAIAGMLYLVDDHPHSFRNKFEK